MLYVRLCAVAALAVFANAQSVISTRSGVVHFFEGAVSINGQPLEPRLGRFPTIPEGAELRTGEGRAEVLLTPGVFLRVDAQSAIRMIAVDLADTQVELLAGSAMVESGVPNSDTSVTLLYRDWGVHFLRQGVYRIGADPPRLWVRQGQAEVFSGGLAKPVAVSSGMSLAFADMLMPEPRADPGDKLRDWEAGRSESISADDAITAQIDEDPASRPNPADGFIDFPLLGVPAMTQSLSGIYTTAGLYQPGFNSIYLPGYGFRPMILGLGPMFPAHGSYPIGSYPIGSYPIGSYPLRAPVVGSRIPGVIVHTPGVPMPGVPTPRPSVLTPPPVSSGVRPAPPPRISAPVIGAGHR